MRETIKADWIKSEAINLENCCNDNPLKILGPHFFEGEWVTRVWMPEADEVTINYKNKAYNLYLNGLMRVLKLKKVDGEGLLSLWEKRK